MTETKRLFVLLDMKKEKKKNEHRGHGAKIQRGLNYTIQTMLTECTSNLLY